MRRSPTRVPAAATHCLPGRYCRSPRRAAWPRCCCPPGVVALPDRDLRSVFIGLRQYGSPVVGPQACDGWTAGLSAVVLSSFNQPGVQLGVERGMQTPTFAETIITGPPSVLDALTDPPLPIACRDITTPHYSGGVKPIAATVPGAVSARAFEVTGTGKVPGLDLGRGDPGRELRPGDPRSGPVSQPRPGSSADDDRRERLPPRGDSPRMTGRDWPEPASRGRSPHRGYGGSPPGKYCGLLGG